MEQNWNELKLNCDVEKRKWDLVTFRINDKTITYAWDHRNRLMSIVYKNNAGTKTRKIKGTQLFNFSRSSLIFPDNNPAKPSEPRQTSYDLVFDAAGRLSSEKVDSWDNAVDRTETFTLDLFGNRTRHQPCG